MTILAVAAAEPATAQARWRGGMQAPAPSAHESRDRRIPRQFQDPASARGYNDGYDHGLEDARGRRRYDPIRHGDYRSADGGYKKEYGSKEAWRTNYRTGFRQGYEAGYRTATRGG